MATKTPPDIEAKIVILRSAGYTIPLIASKTGVSTSTVKRAIKRHPQPSDEAHLNLVAEARTALRDEYGSDDALAGLYASMLADTLHHIEASREIANAALAKLRTTDTKDAALVFRALTAHATTLKAHVDTIKAIAPLPDLISELPILQVSCITDEEVADLRRAQEEEDALMGDGADWPETELVLDGHP
jgi:predicted transcriptional regulator